MEKRKKGIGGFILFDMILLLCLVAGPQGVALAVDHSGSISEDETWAAGDNPHQITGNVTVENLITLTLEPGVEVLFNGNFSIQVYGAILAEGTENDPIRFTRAAGVPSWYGLNLYAGSGGVFSYCTIEWAAQRGISATSCYLSAANCTIRNNGYGLYATSINPYLADNLFENNTTGMRIDSYYAPSVEAGQLARGGQNNVIRDNDTGIYFYDCILPTVAGSAQVFDNTTYGVRFQNCASPGVAADIFGSGTGIYYQNCTDVASLEGIYLAGNTGAYGAILAQDSGPVHLGASNTITDNTYPLSINAASYATEASIIPTADNHVKGIQVISGTSQQGATWYDFDLPYMVTASVTLGASSALTVAPGVEVRLGSAVYIRNNGDFQANGSSENGIIFTRNQAARWNHLAFQSGSAGSLSYTQVEFSSEGVRVNNASPEIDSCTLQNNAIGYYAYGDATSYIHDCLIANNDYGVRVRSRSDPLVNDNCILQNYLYGVLQEDTRIIDAENNFWGDASGPRHVSNPDGRSDFVSDGVDFDPWLTECPL